MTQVERITIPDKFQIYCFLAYSSERSEWGWRWGELDNELLLVELTGRKSRSLREERIEGPHRAILPRSDQVNQSIPSIIHPGPTERHPRVVLCSVQSASSWISWDMWIGGIRRRLGCYRWDYACFFVGVPNRKRMGGFNDFLLFDWMWRQFWFETVKQGKSISISDSARSHFR
jgi:hypothetical protein